MSSSPNLRECFDELIDLAPEQRENWIALHVPDPALREELLAMLDADLRDSPLLSTSAADLVERYTPHDDGGTGLVGSNIGPYRLFEVLGQGGTSVVFRAQRASGTGTQTVALKLLRTGLFSVDSQRRFRREQGVLAHLSHPNIASLIDGGITEAGIPYIAMEFVDGLPITEFAHAHSLSLEARLELLAKTCRAVDSAHHSLVVHRDLKPSNVLVSVAGEIKVLDFGIARLLDDEVLHATQTQAIALTPGYAAPEQYHDGPVTTATDIFSLGILMGELLTGRLGASGHTSSGLSRTCAEMSGAVPAGLPDKPALIRALRGDLDAIYSTAHALDPARRYLSAALLADDIERYLRDEPVAARPPSIGYRLRKSVQRNRAAATAAVLVLVSIIVGLSLTMWQAQIAREQAQRATAVRDFLVELFDAAKAGQMPDQRLTLKQLTERAGSRLQGRTDLSISTRIELLQTLGEVSMAGSDYAQAQLLYGQAAELASTVHAPTDEVTTHIQLLQANLLLRQSRYADAEIAYEALLPKIREGNDVARVESLQNYATALMFSAQTDRALAISDEATRNAATLYGGGSNKAVMARLKRGNLLSGAGHFASAAALIEPALKTWRASQDKPNEVFLQGLTDLSRVRTSESRIADAEALLRETLATAEQLYDAPHVRIALALLNLGDVLRKREHLDEAARVLKRALAMMQTIYGDDHLRVANTQRALALVELRRRDLESAARHIHAAVSWCERPDLHATRSCIELHASQAELALATDNLEEADVSSASALAMTRELFPDGHRWTVRLWLLRAELDLRRNDAFSALDLCDKAQDLLATLGAEDGFTQERVLARRASALNVLGRSNEALADITQALSLWDRLVPEGRLHRIELLDALASIQIRLGDQRAAEETARRGIALVIDRDQIEPMLLARLEVLVKRNRAAGAPASSMR